MPSCGVHSATLAGRLDIAKQFVADIRGRFRPIRGRVRHFAIQQDGFDLRDGETSQLADGDEPDDWPDPPTAVAEATSADAKARAFDEWLSRQLRERVLEPVAIGDTVLLRRASGQRSQSVVKRWSHWTVSYILAAIRRGWELSGGRLRTKGASISSTQLGDGPTVEAMFDIGVRPEFLRRVYLQAYEGLENVVDDGASQQVRETITEGVAEGVNPRTIADRLTKDIRGLQRRRAETHARTTTAHARTQSTLERYRQAGETVVSHVEFSDAADARVCPFCRRLDGTEMTIDEMLGTHVLWRGDIYRLAPPAHAAGRCSPIPSVGASAPTTPLADRVPGTIVTTTADPHALSQSR